MTYNAGLPEDLWHPKQTENGHDSRLENTPGKLVRSPEKEWVFINYQDWLSNSSPRDDRTQDALDENGKAKNIPSFKGQEHPKL